MTTTFLHPIPTDWSASLAVGNNKSTKPGDWKNKRFTLQSLTQATTNHNIGPKDGPCFLQGNATGGVRQAKAMERLSIVGIDIDNGMPSDEIDAIVRQRGLFAIRYTTHSHGKDYTEVRKDDWVKYLRAHDGATIAEYLVAKKRYLPDIAASAAIASEEMTSNGIVLKVSHPEIDKNRLICVLAKPWSVHDYDTQEDALAGWKAAYMNFAAWLGIAVDQSCTDTARLFYLPRREPEALYEAVVHNGKAVDIFALPKTTLSRATSGNVFLDAAAAMGADGTPHYLKVWAAKYGDRFQIFDAIEAHAPNLLRPERDHDGIHHIECPFESDHTNFGGSGTFATNAGESPIGSGFVIKCMHASCAHRDRLDFVAELIRSEVLPDEALTDDAFLIEIEEEKSEAPIEVPKPTEQIELNSVVDIDSADMFVKAIAESDMSPLKAAEELNKLAKHMSVDLNHSVSRTSLHSSYRRYAKEYRTARRIANEKIEAEKCEADAELKSTAKEKENFRKLQAKEKRRKEAIEEEEDRVTLFTDENYLRATVDTMQALVKYNERKARIFRNSGSLCRIVNNEFDYPKIDRLNPDTLRNILKTITRTLRDTGNGLKEDPPLMDVIRDVLAEAEPPFPVLSGIVTAPVFGKDGTINTKAGYSESSQLYFEPNGLIIKNVPEKPSDVDVRNALDMLLNNALVDFPFDGPNDGASERAHALCMILQPFARQLIDGATPIYLICKPTPGTGASKLVDIYSLISTGNGAIAQTETRVEDEMRKRITSVLLEAAPTFYLDNINYRIDSSSLASAVTSSKWTDRVLGETRTIEAPVRHTWIFAGNNPTMSNEIARRCVRIRLDAKVERPERRTNFKHTDLEGWVKRNRAELIWSCLVLIQNWVAKGSPDGDGIKGSFEPWSRVMGGILQCAGVSGFLANDGELREDNDEEGNAIKAFLTVWWSEYGQSPAMTGEDGGLYDIVTTNDIPLNIADGSPQQRKVSFGKYLNRLRERIFSITDDDGGTVTVRVEKAGTTGGKTKWKLAKL